MEIKSEKSMNTDQMVANIWEWLGGLGIFGLIAAVISIIVVHGWGIWFGWF